jgi:2-methylisocitrate lyase-like PEP mutase family enzyme
VTRDRFDEFLALHYGDVPLLLPNPWDAGTAKLFASLGFRALATTSAGFAATLGRVDGSVTRDEVLAHAAVLAAATDLPVNGDLENCFSDTTDGVAETVRLACGTGLAGCSIEDFDPIASELYEIPEAVARVEAAVDAAHSASTRLVVTARAENYFRGRPDLANTVTRLQAYQAAGADVVYAPGITALDDLRTLVDAVDVPVNVLAFVGAPPVADLAEIGVARISVGASFAFVGYGAVAAAAREFLDEGTYRYMTTMVEGAKAARAAFAPPRAPDTAR